MKQSFYILFVTGAFAIAATFVAWVWGGKQEDVGGAIGGVVGFLLANGVVFTFRGPGVSGETQNEQVLESAAFELGFAYGVFAIFYFAFVGWLAGYLHDHGDLAGTVCGGLGGYILAVSVPALHRSSFMAVGRKLQLALSVVALGALLTIVWVMYKHEFL
jgi:cyanate permease